MDLPPGTYFSYCLEVVFCKKLSFPPLGPFPPTHFYSVRLKILLLDFTIENAGTVEQRIIGTG